MHFLADYGIFLLKLLSVAFAILFVIGGIVAIISKAKSKEKTKEIGKIVITKLNEKFNDYRDQLHDVMCDKKTIKALAKQQKQQQKASQQQKPRLFVIHFHGDIRASAVTSLREEVTAILLVARPKDQVLIKLDSPGGLVNAYGLAASQLTRLKDAKIPLTIAIDKMAASGGYMMACIADHIIAAPFAVVGSIGVISQLPNFHRWLKKNNIEFEQLTAGEYKRTLTVFGQNSRKDREKAQEDIDDTHELFKWFVNKYRKKIDINKVATGEHWFAKRAKELKLVDEIRTSDDYLLSAKDTNDIYLIEYKLKKHWRKQLIAGANQAWQRMMATTEQI